jgi:hypothetical protein
MNTWTALSTCLVLAAILAAAGQAEAAVVAASTRWLDHDALARLAAAGLAVVGVAPAGDEDSERRLRQLGLQHVAADTDTPAALVDLTRAAVTAEPTPGPPEPPDAPPPPVHDTLHTLVAVWGPKGAPGRTTVAVNLAFEAAPLVGDVLLVDADTYGGAVAHANIQISRRLSPEACLKQEAPRAQPTERAVSRDVVDVMPADRDLGRCPSDAC